MKDRLDAGEQSGVVYQIPCLDCPRHYTGQTGRRLSSRITEHKRAVRRGGPLSQVATHTLEEGHEFNFAGTRIVAQANNKTGRDLLEAWVSDTNSINRHVDIPLLLSRAPFPRPRADSPDNYDKPSERHKRTIRQILNSWTEHFRSALNSRTTITDATTARLLQIETNTDLDLQPSL
nr:unnamed protein product [Spirometra erinaceieuropaei]